MTARPLITSTFVRMMAAYNAEMNERLYTPAARLGEEERRRDRGAFYGSLHATLNHILWADQIWMSRFDGWTPPPQTAGKSGVNMFHDFETLHRERQAADAKITAWANHIDDAWLAADQTWFSGAAGRELTMARGILVTHLFNHQTHHRGQAHALITAAGEKTADTDLFLIPPAVRTALQPG